MKTIEITDIRIRNEKVRLAIIEVKESNGINYSFIAKLLKVSDSAFSHWKAKKYDYSIENIKRLEEIIERYSFEV